VTPRKTLDPTQSLSRREQQIMDVIYRRERATAADVQREMADPPGYSSIRKQLEILERRGLVRHTVVDRRYVYSAVVPGATASKAALHRIINAFFKGNARAAVVALLAMEKPPTEAEFDAILAEAATARKSSTR
jgi:BlaI family penicillinase repressor